MSRLLLSGLLVLLVGLAAGFWIRQATRDPGAVVDRGPAGIDFVVPAGYEVLELGESTVETAAVRLAARLRTGERFAAVFTRAGDRIHLLVDASAQTVEQHVVSRHGTVRRLLWRGAVDERLAWAGEHGDFDAPGTSPAEARNPYH